MSRPREVVVAEPGAVELRPGQRPRLVRVAILPDESKAAKVGPVPLVPSLQIAELGAHVLAVERTPSGLLAAIAPAGAYVVVLSPGDILGTVL